MRAGVLAGGLAHVCVPGARACHGCLVRPRASRPSAPSYPPPPTHTHVGRRTIESELQLSLEDVFESVDSQPLASASIAQARTSDVGGCVCARARARKRARAGRPLPPPPTRSRRPHTRAPPTHPHTQAHAAVLRGSRKEHAHAPTCPALPPPTHSPTHTRQVHAAVLRGSRKEVVIKVLKPGVEDVLTTGELVRVCGGVRAGGRPLHTHPHTRACEPAARARPPPHPTLAPPHRPPCA